MRKTLIVIGAPRSGTTWLFNNLRHHPAIFAPAVKEVRYFVGSPQPLIRQRQAQTRRNELRQSSEVSQAHYDWLDLWEHTENRQSVEVYRRLMASIPDKPVSIDISPNYCTARAEKVQLFKDALGDTEIVLLMRNPVERDFSHARKEFHMNKGITDPLSLQEYMSFLDRPKIRQRNNYLRALDNWSSVFGRVHTEFYDSILEDPGAVLERILGLVSLKPNSESIPPERRFGAGRKDMFLVPEELKVHLAKRNLPMLRRLAERFPDPCNKWLQKAESLI